MTYPPALGLSGRRALVGGTRGLGAGTDVIVDGGTISTI